MPPQDTEPLVPSLPLSPSLFCMLSEYFIVELHS